MNKAFVREPEADGREYCPRCQVQGIPVGAAALNAHIQPAYRASMGESAYFCGFANCEVAYFNSLESVVTIEQLERPVYPKDHDAPICACFGFSLDDVEADIRDRTPTRIRQLLERSKSPDARCSERAADGRCCIREVQRLFIKLREQTSP